MLRMAGVLGRVTGKHILFASQFDALKRSAQDWILNIRSGFGTQRLEQRISNLRNDEGLGVHIFSDRISFTTLAGRNSKILLATARRRCWRSLRAVSPQRILLP